MDCQNKQKLDILLLNPYQLRSIINLSILLLILTACNCEDVQCPGFNSKFRTYLPADTTAVLTYANDRGEQIVFTKEDAGQSVPAMSVSGHTHYGCGERQCLENAFFQAQSSKLIDNYSVMNIGISTPIYKSVSDTPMKATVSVELFGFRSGFTFFPVLQTDSLIAFHDSLLIGNRVYTQVLALRLDTAFIKTLADSLHPTISQVYLTPQQGIIGFDDWRERTTYYLQ